MHELFGKQQNIFPLAVKTPEYNPGFKVVNVKLPGLIGHTSPVGTCKRVEALQVSHDFKTIFAISSEGKITMT